MTRLLAALAAAVVLLAGCVTPAIDSGAFRQNAVGALESGLAETNTAVLVVEQVRADQITDPLADIALSQTEDAMGPIQDSFGKVQPPDPRLDSLRTDVLTALGDAESAIADARIAARRGNPAGLRQALAALEAAVKDIEALQARLR